MQQFFTITLPLLRQNMLVAVLLAITGGFAGFDLFFTMTNGGPFGATEVPATWIMKQAFDQNQMSYGIALTVVLAVVVMLISLVYLTLLRAAQCHTATETPPQRRRMAAVRGRALLLVAIDVLPDDLDGALGLQDQPRDFPHAFRAARPMALGELCRGVGAGRARHALPQLDLRHGGGGDALRRLRHGGGIRLRAARVSGPAARSIA